MATGDPPSVSVVVPCHDHGRFLAEAVDSVLASGHPVEVVVVDDGSTDDTAEVAAAYGDRIRFVQQENRGLPAARNAGFAVATGELVNFLDADDRHGEGFLDRMVQAAVAEPDTSVFCGAWNLCDVDGNPQGEGRVRFPGDPYRFLLGGNPMPCQAVVVRRSAFACLGDPARPFDESLRAFEDWDLWLRLAAAGQRFAPVEGASVDYRRYPGSMSRDVSRMLGAARNVLAKHRGRHPLRRLRAMRAIRFGQFCENVLPEVRRRGLGAWAGAMWRHPALVESALLYAALSALPPLRRVFRVSGRPWPSR